MSAKGQRSEIRDQTSEVQCLCTALHAIKAGRGRRTRRAVPQRKIGIRTANSDGFTIIEILAVLLILSILITMLVSVVGVVQRKTQQERAQTDANALVQAVLRYQQVYGAWPREQSRTNADYFVAGVGDSNKTLFSAADPNFPPAADVDQADIMAALAPDSSFNPRRILFLPVATNALSQGRLTDPWGNPYLLVMDARHVVFAIGELVFSNLPAFAISAGAPVANPCPSSNWIFSAGVRP